jgi:hypothetical protein
MPPLSLAYRAKDLGSRDNRPQLTLPHHRGHL